MEKEKKKNKKIIIIAAVIAVLILIFIIWFFNRKFEVTYIYNNGDTEAVAYVKYLRRAPKDLAKEDITYEGYTLLGYYETYYLNGKEIEAIKKDSAKESSICKKGFVLNTNKDKCISEKKFDFNTKIKEEKTIEALWSKNDEPAPVIMPVTTTTTTKKNTTTTAKKDNGTISLSLSNKCMIGSNPVTVTANVSNTTNDKINWSFPNCFSNSGTGSSIVLTRSCSNNERTTATISAKLNNGQTASASFNYEPAISYTVYDGNSVATRKTDGSYEVGNARIVTNVPANFEGSYIKSKTDNSVSLYSSAASTIKITTNCGQSATVRITALIN